MDAFDSIEQALNSVQLDELLSGGDPTILDDAILSLIEDEEVFIAPPEIPPENVQLDGKTVESEERQNTDHPPVSTKNLPKTRKRSVKHEKAPSLVSQLVNRITSGNNVTTDDFANLNTVLESSWNDSVQCEDMEYMSVFKLSDLDYSTFFSDFILARNEWMLSICTSSSKWKTLIVWNVFPCTSENFF